MSASTIIYRSRYLTTQAQAMQKCIIHLQLEQMTVRISNVHAYMYLPPHVSLSILM
uniref:Uncharacterized protein n=1 Tax=Rhizophora mucronata TaxID=61149 RepID=A0A2P2LTS9_RHIMU